MEKTYSIKTFGCQMNHSDSERIAGFLESLKFKKSADIQSSDLVIFNTCGVRQMAEDRVYGQIHNIRKQDIKNKPMAPAGRKQKMIILTGCLAHREDVRKRLKDKVDLFFSINNFNDLENFIYQKYSKIENRNSKISAERIDYLSINPLYNNSYQALVPIMTGCNNFCAYCVVPAARGREVSRPAGEIIAEIKSLVKKGYKEIILLGQNVNSYKHFVENRNSKIENLKSINFPTLLKSIENIKGKFWLSFVSSHPKDYSDELIETIARSKKICEYIHLPIQAGDDKVLERMNRKYTQKHYLNLVRKIKSTFKKHKPKTLYAITSDIIVGFPGETRKQFMESAKVMETVKYDMVYFGQFSPRPGTVAWKMKDNVSKKEKSRREKFLNEILKKTNYANNKKYVGNILEVIVDKEENHKTKSSDSGSSKALPKSLALGKVYFGRTRTMKNIKLTSKKPVSIGSLVKAKVTKTNVWNLEGEIL